MSKTLSDLEQQLPIEQLALLLKQSIPAFAATMVVLLYILFKVPDTINQFWLYSWAAVICFINIYLIIWIYLCHHRPINTISAKRFILAYQIEAVLHGFSWGMLPFLLAEISSPDLQFFAYIALCGMAAGAIGTTGMIYHIYLSFMLPMMLPAIFTQMIFSDNIHLFAHSTVEFLIIFVVSLMVLGHTHYDSVKRSITLMIENKKLLNETTEAYNKAEAANQAKSAFLANMSHELRTPLNAVIGYSELIYDVAKDENISAVKNDANKITHAGKHLLSLINNVLDLSKIESGKMDIFLEKIDFSKLLNDIQLAAEHLTEENGNQLIIEINNNLGTITSDYTKIKQILFNIIGNAAKFTTNGEIKIIAETLSSDDHISIKIIDTGIGMTEDQLSDLSKPFIQADSSTTRKYGGTGLGMSVTDHLTKVLNITYTVTSAPNEGTVFTLLIPRDCS